jgi:hypothetical protein
MDLNTVTEIGRPASRGDLAPWRDGDAWLAGGTWLFSEPQPALTRLIDLSGLGWPALETSAEGLRIGATCTLAQLAAAEFPPVLPSAARFVQDLERGDGWRESVHGAAGGSDGGADRGAGRSVLGLAAAGRRTPRAGG